MHIYLSKSSRFKSTDFVSVMIDDVESYHDQVYRYTLNDGPLTDICLGLCWCNI